MEKILSEILSQDRQQLFSGTQIDAQLPYIKPAVVIGLGGSGTKAVARLKKRMETWAESYATTYSKLRRTEGVPEEEVRDTVAQALKRVASYLAIDTLSFPNLAQEDPVVAETLGNDDYLYAGGFNPVDYISRQYTGDENLQRWWEKDFHPPYTYIDDGARRFRMLGRLALYRVREEFHNRLASKVADVVELRQSLVNMGLIRAARETSLNEILVYLVTGSNGGTGSGMFFDAVFHAFAAVRDVGDLLPKIRIIIVSPRIYMLMSSESGSGLNDALTANAYAFFQSLALIVERPKEAIEYVFDYHTNPILQTQAKDFNEYWRPDKVYIVDTEISGQEIRDLDGMLTNAADYLYLDISQPVTIGGAQIVNLEQVLEEKFKGHRRILASFGISYLTMPTMTIIKGLVTLLVNDVLDYIGKAGKSIKVNSESATKDPAAQLQITDGKKIAESFVRELVKIGTESPASFENWCEQKEIGSMVVKELTQQWEKEKEPTEDSSVIGSLLHALESEHQKKDAERKEIKGNLLKKNIMFGSIGAVGIALIAWIFAAETELMPPVIASIFSAVVGGGIGYLISYLLTGRERIELREFNQKLDELAVKKRRYHDAVGKVKKILKDSETKKTSEFSQIGGRVRDMATQLREYVTHYIADQLFKNFEPDEVTSKYTSIYCWGFEQDQQNELKPIFGMPSKLRAEQMLRTMFIPSTTISTDENKKIQPETSLNLAYHSIDELRFFSETVVGILSEAAEKIRKEKLSGDEQDNLLRAIVEKASPVVLDAYARRFGVQEKPDLRLWNGLEGFDKATIVKMRSQFEDVGEQLRSLSDPTWAYDVEDSPRTKRIAARHLVPKQCKDAFDEVWGKERVQGVLYDKRMAITVQSEFGIPIFALRGMREWKKKYETWMLDWRARGEAPPHVDKRWLDSGIDSETPTLPALEPNDEDKITQWYLRFLLMGNYIQEHSAVGNNLDLKRLKNSRGESFEAFWNNIVKDWEIGDEGGNVKTTENLTEEELNEYSQRIFTALKTYYDKFRQRVTNSFWGLGEIAAFWDGLTEVAEFKTHYDKKKKGLVLLYKIIQGAHIPRKDELKDLLDNLGGIFRIKTLDQVTYKESDPGFLTNFALAVSRL